MALYARRVANRSLCSVAQAESLRYKLMMGLAVRRACYGVLRFIMDSSAKGCEIIVSGKLRAQRAKAMKFVDGYMIKTGTPTSYYVDKVVRHVLLRQGVLGIKVSIMLDHDPAGITGPSRPQPDVIRVIEPKEDDDHTAAPAGKFLSLRGIIFIELYFFHQLILFFKGKGYGAYSRHQQSQQEDYSAE